MSAARSAKPRPWLRRLRYSIYLLVAIMLGSEVLLRVLDPLGIWYLYEINRYSKEMMVSNQWFSYIHEPGVFDTVQGVGVSINSHGLRGPEFPSEKPAGKIRLMILGNSVVFGWGVRKRRRFRGCCRWKWIGWEFRSRSLRQGSAPGIRERNMNGSDALASISPRACFSC